jgi:hypothetical protein
MWVSFGEGFLNGMMVFEWYLPFFSEERYKSHQIFKEIMIVNVKNKCLNYFGE